MVPVRHGYAARLCAHASSGGQFARPMSHFPRRKHDQETPLIVDGPGLLIVAGLPAACGQPAAPTAAPAEPTAAPEEPTVAPEEPTAVPEEQTAAPEEPTAEEPSEEEPTEPTEAESDLLWSKELRQAIAAAIDREEIVDRVFEGRNIPAYHMVPPGYPYATEPFMDMYGQQDLDLAIELLTELGFTEDEPAQIPSGIRPSTMALPLLTSCRSSKSSSSPQG